MKSKRFYLIAVLLLVAGFTTFLVGFSMMDFNPQNFDSEPPYIERVYKPVGSPQKIVINDSEADINITASKDNTLRIKYYENVNKHYAVTESAGEIKLSKRRTSGFIHNLLTLSKSNLVVTVEVPENFAGSITVKTTNGNLTAEDASFKNLNADIKNGNVRLSNLSLSGQADIKSDGGEIRVYDITLQKNCKLLCKNGELFAWSITADKLYSTSENGLMTLAYINADSIFAENDERDIKISCLSFKNDAHLLSEKGNITGTVLGVMEDFTFNCQAPNGNSNIDNTLYQGDKNLHITTEEGNIDISLNSPT